MDDKTPTPDPTPDETLTPAAAAAPAADSAPTTPSGGSGRQQRGRTRGLLIGGGIAAAVVLLGGGVAVGAAIGDEFGEDDDDLSSSVSDSSDQDSDAREDDDTDEPQAPSDGAGPAADIGTASADELIEIADAARGAASGAVTSIDAKRDGTWTVQLITEGGEETEVRVAADLAASVVEIEAAEKGEPGPALTLDDETIRSLVSAALAEADGKIIDLEIDDDEVSPYDASVLTSERRSIDIALSADFAVVE